MNGEVVCLGLSGFGVLIEGDAPLVTRLAERLRERWPRFVVSHGTLDGGPILRLTLDRPEGAPPDGPFRPKEMVGTLASDRARFELPEGFIALGSDDRGLIQLRDGLSEREYFAFENLLRAGLAWWLPRHGGLLVHAAGLVVDERAYLLIGSEGAGKSTWATLGSEGGARVLSDDLVLVATGPDGVEALGAPFRSTHWIEYVPGRWPLAALLFPHHGAPPAWWAATPLVARARLAANLPFIAEGIAADPAIDRAIERMIGLPCLEFRFDRDPGFLELLRREALPGDEAD